MTVAPWAAERRTQMTVTRSPHAIQLYDVGIADDGAFYYVMELLAAAG
jgi:hypothetical protein